MEKKASYENEADTGAHKLHDSFAYSNHKTMQILNNLHNEFLFFCCHNGSVASFYLKRIYDNK